ncbi:hypothetical protein QX233_02140 [Chryseobacterium gambrini]|uniref:Uncharacterized protein n=1 Tax=Chryseobacterium gambrini TaxID=373672 RepID=A0AAJ1VJ04_9FLAO|nr:MULTISPECIES: hypothetical protein [Chryseobacterium]MDN4011251.1 hypothetical protein [Chryseobacterium gambrini]MDN4031022.1 hypothetical protein [Chryseobacterium gambrini]QWA38026.1 hypothetical protein KKI44_19360 [Chryseobacterium sp. ZHDP1]
MSHIVLKKWEQLKQRIIQDKENLDAHALLRKLLDWTQEIKKIKDVHIQNLYKLHFSYYEKLDIEEIFYNDNIVWYSLEEIIQYDIIQAKVDSYQWAIEHVDHILFNLLIFKTDKDCPCCHDDNLRVFVESDSKKLIFECELCLCLIDENNNKQNSEEKLFIPAPASLIKRKRIKPSPI